MYGEENFHIDITHFRQIKSVTEVSFQLDGITLYFTFKNYEFDELYRQKAIQQIIK